MKNLLLIITLLAATCVADAAEKGAEKLTGKKAAKKNHGTVLQSHSKQVGNIGPFQVHSLRIRGLDSPNVSAAVIFDPRSETYTVIGPATGAGLGSAILGAAGNVGSSAVFGLSLRPTRINENVSNNSQSEGSSSESSSEGGSAKSIAEGGDASSVSKSAGGSAYSVSDADAKSTSSSASSAKNENVNRNSSVNSNSNRNSSVNSNSNRNTVEQVQSPKAPSVPKRSKKSKKSKH